MAAKKTRGAATASQPRLPANWPFLSRQDLGVLKAVNTRYNRKVADRPQYPNIDYAALREKIERELSESGGRGSGKFISLGGTAGKAESPTLKRLLAGGWASHNLLDDAEDFDVEAFFHRHRGRGKRRRDRGNRDRNRERRGGDREQDRDWREERDREIRGDRQRDGEGDSGLIVAQPQGEQHQSSGRRKRKGGGGGGHQLANPQIVAKVVGEVIARAGLKPVGLTEPVVRAGLNFEFGDEAKINWHAPSYLQIIPLAHMWACSEISNEGALALAKLTGYQCILGVENTRGQSTVVLIHPRFKVVGHFLIDTDEVQGVNDLRKVPVALLEDTSPDCPPDEKKSYFGCHHGKSMRGGEERTAAVRALAHAIIVKALKDAGAGAVMGDFNLLPNTFWGQKAIEVMTDGGFKLVDPDDTRPTHIGGSRLDLAFTRNLPRELHIRAVLAWFATAIDRGLSDHGALVVT